MSKKVVLTKEEWKQRLDSLVYHVCFEKGTEPPFTGVYNNYHGDGTFLCSCCGEELFSSASKFDSGSGWPSFYEAISPKNITETTDRSHEMERTEVTCSSCGAHLGHVFGDGPDPTGQRYCINSVSLKIKEDK